MKSYVIKMIIILKFLKNKFIRFFYTIGTPASKAATKARSENKNYFITVQVATQIKAQIALAYRNIYFKKLFHNFYKIYIG